MKKSFTLIEILVVVTIIVLLTATAVVTYTAFLKQSRDAKRKADLEQVRAAVEMYRSNNNTYPVGSWSNLSVLTSGTVYIQSVPTDPKNSTYIYYYNGSLSDYTLAAQFENTSSCTSGAPGGNSCGAGNPCNYCVGPYGQK
ncbi:MAG: type II secretion system protein GspG [Patescibacteria group bacterium]